jgi:hypothetical protein
MGSTLRSKRFWSIVAAVVLSCGAIWGWVARRPVFCEWHTSDRGFGWVSARRIGKPGRSPLFFDVQNNLLFASLDEDARGGGSGVWTEGDRICLSTRVGSADHTVRVSKRTDRVYVGFSDGAIFDLPAKPKAAQLAMQRIDVGGRPNPEQHWSAVDIIAGAVADDGRSDLEQLLRSHRLTDSN